MKSFIIILILILNSTLALSNEFEIETVTIGKFKIGASEKLLTKYSSDCKFIKGKKIEWGSDGMFHQNWKSSACGLEVDMVSDTDNSTQFIASILVFHPSLLETNTGIKIGSNEDEVLMVYGPFINRNESSPHNSIVVGSIYGGVQFSIENYKVKTIFVGSSAE